MTIVDALAILEINLKPLCRWRRSPDKSYRIFKIALKKAFKRKALQTHPDKTGGDSSQFREVAAANELLNSVDESELSELVAEIVAIATAKRKAQYKDEPPKLEIKVEPRGSKIKITHICEFGIVTSFVSKVVGVTTKSEVDDWTKQIIKAMRSSGLIPDEATSARISEKLRRYYSDSGYDFVGRR